MLYHSLRRFYPSQLVIISDAILHIVYYEHTQKCNLVAMVHSCADKWCMHK